MDTPLAYTYREMLRNEKNEKEVLQILEELFGSDIVWPGKEKDDEKLLEKLKGMGEDKIYKAVEEAIKARSK